MTRSYMSAPYWLDPENKTAFPDVNEALLDPDGLLAIGGDLSEERLLAAYRRGIFPWYSDGQPILWWSPNPRAVLFPDELKVSRSLKKTIKHGGYRLSMDTAFPDVIHACSQPRRDSNGTWITNKMFQAYISLHQAGHAHSVEVWHDEQLAGGLYGVAIGKVFFGESMFSHKTDASKLAFVFLVEQLHKWQFGVIDCQVYSTHLGTLGARVIPRDDFIRLLDDFCDQPDKCGHWQFDIDINYVISRL